MGNGCKGVIFFLIFSAKIYFQKLTTRFVHAIIYRNEQVKYVFY